MKAGDFVGWADTWSDEEGCEMAGIILETTTNAGWGQGDCLVLHIDSKIGWQYAEALVVMFEGR